MNHFVNFWFDCFISCTLSLGMLPVKKNWIQLLLCKKNKHLFLKYGILNQIFGFVFHCATIKMSITIFSRCLIYFMANSKGSVIDFKIVWCVLNSFINGMHLVLRLPTKNLRCCKIVCNLQDQFLFITFSFHLKIWIHVKSF